MDKLPVKNVVALVEMHFSYLISTDKSAIVHTIATLSRFSSVIVLQALEEVNPKFNIASMPGSLAPLFCFSTRSGQAHFMQVLLTMVSLTNLNNNGTGI